MNVFGLQLFFYSNSNYPNYPNYLHNSRREFDNDCTHDDLNAAIADNQLKIRKSLKKEEKQKALFTAWRQCDKTIIMLTKRGEKRKFDG